MGIQTKYSRRTTDIRFPGADYNGGSDPVNPDGIVGTLTHQTGSGARFTITDAGTTGLTIDQLLHKITRIVAWFATGDTEIIEKEDITVDEANDRISWTRAANGAGVEMILFSSGPEDHGNIGAIAQYAAAGS